MIEALIFDLDNCLAPAMEIGNELYEPALEAMKKANHGTISSNTLEEAVHDIWSNPFDSVASKHGFSTAMIDVGIREFGKIETQGPLYGYGRPVCPQFFRHPLVFGDLRLSSITESKVRALGIAAHF